MAAETDGMTKPPMMTLWILSTLLLALRLLFISTTMVVDDEAYYLAYARHLDWGYIDHGPVVGYLVRILTLVFGENGFGIRAAGVLMITVLGVVLYRFGKRHFSAVTGAVLSLTVTVNMLTHLNSVVMTPDAPLMFFTILAILTYYRAFSEDGKHLPLAGLFLGLALLSKISAALPALAVVLFPVISRRHRTFLKQPRFYASLAIALLVFLPFVIWNVRNDYAFFRYQGSHVARKGGLVPFVELWAGLLLLTGPVFFFYAAVRPIWLMLAKRSLGGPEWRLFFGLVTFVPLVYFLAHSMFSRLELNWPAPVLCGGIFLFGVSVGTSWSRRKGLFRFQIGYSLALIAVVTFHTYVPILPSIGRSDITERYYHYTAFREGLTKFLDKHPEASELRIAANNYQIPSMVNLYQAPKQEAICLSVDYHETLYGFLYPDETLIGDDFLIIAASESFPHPLRSHFKTFSRVGTLESKRRNKSVRTHGLWMAESYTGRMGR